MQETFRRAHEHGGAAFVEVLQNCNVFNDGAFEKITAKDARPTMLIPLRHGEPIVFGPEGSERGVVQRADGKLDIASVADVGLDAVLVHDEKRPDPGFAFRLSRLANGPYEPTPIGVFRAVERPEYGAQMAEQVTAAQEKRGLGDLGALLRSAGGWTVE
jgi:2-oxoglutarate ferredoxin oxidoreductase subunit beta